MNYSSLTKKKTTDMVKLVQEELDKLLDTPAITKAKIKQLIGEAICNYKNNKIKAAQKSLADANASASMPPTHIPDGGNGEITNNKEIKFHGT